MASVIKSSAGNDILPSPAINVYLSDYSGYLVRIQVMMKKYIFLLGAVLMGTLPLACTTDGTGAGNGDSSVADANFQIEGSFPNCRTDSIRVYSIDGLRIKAIAAAPLVEKNGEQTFSLSGKVPEPGIYLVGQAPQNFVSVFLGQEKGIRLSGNCFNLKAYAKIENSPANDALESMTTELIDWQQNANRLLGRISREKNPDSLARLNETLANLRGQKQQLLDSLDQENPILAKLARLSVFEPFDPHNNPQNYANAAEHFGGEMFRDADLSDPAYNHLPVQDYVANYISQSFNPNSLPREKSEGFLDALLQRIPQGSQAHKNVLAAAVNVMEQMKAASFPKYARQFLNEYPQNEQMTQTINNRIASIQELVRQQEEENRLLGVGAIPPDINLPTPEGKKFSIRDLKGKVVLLDFWASWCGPCRVENPNVVRIYKKYKPQGFEIVGVSLDRDRTSWLQAIEKDNLGWHHVSDLKFWNSAAAQSYKVRAIPATFLLDRDGKILAKNLRGRALEQKLEEIFSS